MCLPLHGSSVKRGTCLSQCQRSIPLKPISDSQRRAFDKTGLPPYNMPDRVGVVGETKC